ncbi:MAG: hypothetical protein ACFFCI_12455 [Promethearchaeota archaeon]
MYEESKKLAEKKIREKQIKLEEFELTSIKGDDDVDLTIDEFEEEDEEIPMRFEKRKAGKADLEDSEEFAEVECPFCGEMFDDLATHIQTCEFAPDDVSLDDVLPQRPKKKKKKRPVGKSGDTEKKETSKEKCPYCGKEFIRLGRHLNSCSKKPEDSEDIEVEDE